MSSGVPALDAMFGRRGFYQGSSVLVTGTAGATKTTLAALFAHTVCAGGRSCLFFAFEESPRQLIRDMRSVGLDLGPAVAQGRLRIEASRPALNGLERHLVTLHKLIREFRPAAVVIDPVGNLNRRWFDFSGQTPGPAPDSLWGLQIHPDDTAPAAARWGRSLRTGEPFEVEYRFRNRAGDYRWMSGRTLPSRDETGAVVQ